MVLTGVLQGRKEVIGENKTLLETYNSNLFGSSTPGTGCPVHFDFFLEQNSLVHRGQGGRGSGVLLELHEAVGIIARLSNDLASLDLPDLAEDSEDEVLGHVVVQVADVQRLRRPTTVLSPATHFFL